MTIQVKFRNPITHIWYDLENNMIDFNAFQLGETKKIEVQLFNTDTARAVRDVVVNAIAHPTKQTGTAEDTYQACEFAPAEIGPYSKPYNLVGGIPAGQAITIWMKWQVEMDSLPGWGIFAVKATGVYDL